jgi:hypothetical protein
VDEYYWRSRAGLEHRYRDRRRRIGYIILDQEPTAKGKHTDEQSADFRDSARQQLISLAQHARPRAPFAIDIDFRTTRPQPPKIEKLTKFYLDLLATSDVPPTDPLIYRDDRQVRMLFVRSSPWTYGRSDPTSGRVHITAQPRADALCTLELARDLDSGDETFESGCDRDTDADMAPCRVPKRGRGIGLGVYAAGWYSLIRPPRTG